jgi:hypothetical protein
MHANQTMAANLRLVEYSYYVSNDWDACIRSGPPYILLGSYDHNRSYISIFSAMNPQSVGFARPLQRGLIRLSFFGEIRVAGSQINDDNKTKFWKTTIIRSSLGVRACDTVVFHDGQRGCLYRF